MTLLSPPTDPSISPFLLFAAQPGSFFEYRVWDPNLYKEIRPWTRGESLRPMHII
jgi:hypothetical protein